MKINLEMILFWLISVAYAQIETFIDIQNKIVTVIPPNQTKNYRFITEDVPPTHELYVSAISISPNPLQLPALTLTSQHFQLNCYKAHYSYSSICRVPKQQLIPNRQFHLSLSCLVECKIKLQLYSEEMMSVELGDELILGGLGQLDIVEVIKVEIPSNIMLTSLQIMAFIDNYEEVLSNMREDITMLVNYGINATSPSEQNFMVESQQLFNGGRVLVLGGDMVHPGDMVKIYLKIQGGVRVRFSVGCSSEVGMKVSLGRWILDTLSASDSRVYRIQDQGKILGSDETIEIAMDVFSGRPQIEIGFDANFNNKIKFNVNSPSLSVEITPQMRTTYKYSQLIFVKVMAAEATQFIIYSQIVNQQAVQIRPNTLYFDQLSQEEVYSYILDQKYQLSQITNQTNYLKKYHIKVQQQRGKGHIVVARCIQAEFSPLTTQSLAPCILNSSSTLIGLNNRIITTIASHSASISIISFEYDARACSLIERQEDSNKGKIQIRHCVFQIVALGESTVPWDYNLLLQRKFHLNYLRQGQILKQFISKNTYSYFVFAILNEPINNITFFTNTFSGTSTLIISRKEKFPTIDSPDILSDSGVKCKITLSEVAEYYIGVYASNFAQVSLGAIVNRKNRPPNSIVLSEGVLFAHRIEANQTQVYFEIILKYKRKVVVTLNEVVGLTEMIIVGDGKQVECSEKGRRQQCSFESEQDNARYKVVVSGRLNKIEQFTIGYYEQRVCKFSLLNSPIYVSLSEQQYSCFSFGLSRPTAISFSVSASAEILLGLETWVSLGNSSLKRVDISDYFLSPAETMMNCSMLYGGQLFSQSCILQISVIASIDSDFSLSVDQQDRPMAMFDGVSHTLAFLSVSQDQRYLFYRVQNTRDIKIYISSGSTESAFTLNVYFSSCQGILNINNYPQPNDTQHIQHTSTFLKHIPTSQIPKQSNICLLITLKIHNNLTKLSNTTTRVTVEIVQTQTTLNLGDSKIGEIQQNQINTYLIQPHNGIITIRPLDKSVSDQPCASVSGNLANGTIVLSQNIMRGIIQFTKQDNIQMIILEGKQKHCSYQISYISVAQTYKYYFTNNVIVFVSWMLLPFALAAGLVFYVLKYCIRKIMMRQKNMVQEVQIVANTVPTIASNSKLADGINYPDSATTKIKQQL